MDEELINALKKRAKGYSFSEVQEEYSVSDDGQMSLTKRKVSEKYCPPDTAALKTYMEICRDEELSQMSDEQLEKEKRRLLRQLLEEEKALEKERTENALFVETPADEHTSQAVGVVAKESGAQGANTQSAPSKSTGTECRRAKANKCKPH